MPTRYLNREYGVDYEANSLFGLGSDLDCDNYVVFDGTDDHVMVSGLTAGSSSASESSNTTKTPIPVITRSIYSEITQWPSCRSLPPRCSSSRCS